MSAALIYALVELAISIGLSGLLAEVQPSVLYIGVYVLGLTVGASLGVLWTRLLMGDQR